MQEPGKLCAKTLHAALALGLSIVVEGIEDADQLVLLRELGCSQGQGYLFARPSEAHEVMGFMADPDWLMRAERFSQPTPG